MNATMAPHVAHRGANMRVGTSADTHGCASVRTAPGNDLKRRDGPDDILVDGKDACGASAHVDFVCEASNSSASASGVTEGQPVPAQPGVAVAVEAKNKQRFAALMQIDSVDAAQAFLTVSHEVDDKTTTRKRDCDVFCALENLFKSQQVRKSAPYTIPSLLKAIAKRATQATAVKIEKLQNISRLLLHAQKQEKVTLKSVKGLAYLLNLADDRSKANSNDRVSALWQLLQPIERGGVCENGDMIVALQDLLSNGGDDASPNEQEAIMAVNNHFRGMELDVTIQQAVNGVRPRVTEAVEFIAYEICNLHRLELKVEGLTLDVFRRVQALSMGVDEFAVLPGTKEWSDALLTAKALDKRHADTSQMRVALELCEGGKHSGLLVQVDEACMITTVEYDEGSDPTSLELGMVIEAINDRPCRSKSEVKTAFEQAATDNAMTTTVVMVRRHASATAQSDHKNSSSRSYDNVCNGKHDKDDENEDPEDVAIFDSFAVAGDGEEAEVRRTLPTAAETMAVQRAADAAMRSAMEMGVAREVAEQIRLAATLAVASYEEPPRVHEPLGGGDNLSKAAGPLETEFYEGGDINIMETREALKDAVCAWQISKERLEDAKAKYQDDMTTNPLLGDKLSAWQSKLDALRIRISGNEVENEEGGEEEDSDYCPSEEGDGEEDDDEEASDDDSASVRSGPCSSVIRNTLQTGNRRKRCSGGGAPRVSQPIPGLKQRLISLCRSVQNRHVSGDPFGTHCSGHCETCFLSTGDDLFMCDCAGQECTACQHWSCSRFKAEPEPDDHEAFVCDGCFGFSSLHDDNGQYIGEGKRQRCV